MEKNQLFALLVYAVIANISSSFRIQHTPPKENRCFFKEVKRDDRKWETSIKKPLTFGFDLEGTEVEEALVDSAGRILSINPYPAKPGNGSEGVVADLWNAANNFRSQAGQKAEALGVGAASLARKKLGGDKK